jgi:dTDP-4-dehydrorhamnose reductase
LLSWAAKQTKITGYDSYMWNGVTAVELAKILFEQVIPRKLSNILHIHRQTSLSKYEILKDAKEILGWGYEIVPESYIVDKEQWRVTNMTMASEMPEFIIKTSFKRALEEMRDIWKS